MNTLGFDKPAGETRVVVAMSGGVDSSVAAAQLAADGYDVVGITLQLYDQGGAAGRPGTCCAGKDIDDARRVAERLGIPHYVLDYEARFRREVIDDFAASYAAGETPIPCVRCNQRIKFADLLGTALDLGADALATGHYVRREVAPAGPRLFRAAETERDQSYFLFATTRSQLAVLRFPLGGLQKAETRRLAERFGLPVADKPDSQDICFVPGGRYASVIDRLQPDAFRAGEIVDLDARVLGRHDGIGRFTVGQRRGLKIAADEPLFVIRLEPAAARVVVGPRQALHRASMQVREVNWLGDVPLDATGTRVHVKMRSAMRPVAARVHGRAGDRAEVLLDQPYPGVAPGQACVFYDGDRMLGGGWICRSEASEVSKAG